MSNIPSEINRLTNQVRKLKVSCNCKTLAEWTERDDIDPYHAVERENARAIGITL
jgi:hypothetical protein